METKSVKDSAAALRRALREAFPETKFSVRLATGTAYGWVAVRWVDGPQEESVRALGRTFQGMVFDGQEDGYHSTGSPWGLDGVTTHRTISTDRITTYLAHIKTDNENHLFIPDEEGGRFYAPSPHACPEELARCYCLTR